MFVWFNLCHPGTGILNLAVEVIHRLMTSGWVWLTLDPLTHQNSWVTGVAMFYYSLL